MSQVGDPGEPQSLMLLLLPLTPIPFWEPSF